MRGEAGNTRLAATAALLFLLAALPAASQSSPASADQAARELMRILVPASSLEDIYRQGADSAVEGFRSSMEPGLGRTLTESELGRLRTFWDGWMRKALPWSALEEVMAPILARHFTQTEIEEANRFYSSPAGRKITSLIGQISREARIEGQELGRRLMADPKVVAAMTEGLKRDFPEWFAGVQTGPVPARTLKVAILAPLSGPVPGFGVSVRDGALLAIEEWNGRGGVAATKIEPVVEDSQCSPEAATAAARRVIDQQGVRYILGEVCSKASIPVSEICSQAGVIQVTPTSTDPDVTVDPSGRTKPFIFRACFIDPYQGTLGARFARETLKARTAFVLLDQRDNYVKGLAATFERDFGRLGGSIVGKEMYTAGDTDFSTILARVKAAKPDVVYLPDYYNVVNLVTRQAKDKGIKAPFLGGDGWDSPDLDAKAADGGFFTNHYSSADTSAATVDFKKAYGARFRDAQGRSMVPDALAALSYDAANLLLKAIDQAGGDDPARVAKALTRIELDGAAGRLRGFDPRHDPVKSGVIMAVRGGRVVLAGRVEP